MEKRKSLFILLCLFIYSCYSNENCSNARNRQQSCNIVVTDNINKSSHWGGDGILKLSGINLSTKEKVLYKSKSREWRVLSDYISVSDTVFKKEGEAIMYVYKKDSIVVMNLSKVCNPDFDLRKGVFTFIIRDTIN